MSFHKYIYLLGERLRNPFIREKLKELQQTDFTSLETLEELQLSRLKKLLHHARENSVFYAQRLDNIDIDSMTLANLAKIPPLSKRDLYDNVETIVNNPSGEKLIKSETSGSTGDALIFFRTREWDAYHRAAQFRGYSWYGVNPWDKNIYFWGFNPSWKRKLKMRLLDFLLNRYRIFSFNDKVLDHAAQMMEKCTYVEGYSSAVFTLSQHLQKRGLYFPNVKLVKGTSEKIYDSYHDVTRDVFGKKMTSEYGAAEAGIIAFECPHGNMHITMENVIVEVIDDKILVTNLHSHSFPIIRYELGDYVRLSEAACPCGRAHPVIAEITGRIGKKIVGYKSSYPTLTLYYIFKNIALEHKIELAYFASQYEKGKLFIEILMPKHDESILIDYVQEEAERYFGNDIQVDVKFVYSIERKEKKVKDFESYID